ncbi:sulfatase family protein [Gaoshiqia sediminis]|uniref:Sulfatase n=1 Tax=Gaoshiqia sediminis TaxID=2986998 RepID=A0AA41Y9P2_9BACT|nr:sulfatase [Gaoshiqia sediminis]MCW0484515.1 sulfatase [Gaoshiqia sediminis]
MNKLVYAASLTVFCAHNINSLAQEKPNIVIYLADDQGQADGTVYGAKVLQTPTAEKLAREGLTFNNAFVASPACAPSRAALLTGLMPSRNGAEANHAYPKPGIPVLTVKLREAGYKVLGFGKVAHEKMNYECGFDFYSEPKVKLYDHVSEYFANNTTDQPVCLLVGDRRPHVPWTTKNIYNPDELELPPYFIDTKETREHWGQYYSDITGFDAEMGKVYALAQEKFGDNFIFIYSADHGGQWPFGKWNLYDAGIKVPLIVVWPGRVKPGTRTDAMVSWIDILPTLLEIAGTKVSGDLDGQSFKKVLEGKTDKFREHIFTTHSGDGKMNVYPIRSVRDDRFKFILNLYPENYHSNHSDILRKPRAGAYWDSWDEAARTDPAAAAIIQKYYVRPAEEFYDLETDPTEQKNLIDSNEHQEQIQKMRQLLEEWMKEQGDTRALFETPYPISGPTPHERGIR